MSVDDLVLIPMTYGDYFQNIKTYCKLVMKANPSENIRLLMINEILQILDITL